MRLLIIGFRLAGIVLLSALLLVGNMHGIAASPQTERRASDPIVGAWKLDVEKSTHATVESEILTIVPQGKEFKLTFVAMQSNKYNPHYEVVTDMKGTVSSPTDSGKPMNGGWRFSRTGPNGFVQEDVGPFGGGKKEYSVSTDGKTLTVREVPGNSGIIGGKVDSNGIFHRVQHDLVFERISDTEGQRLIQEMVDTDAAQKAAGAKWAAERAALDAVACKVASGQAGSSDSTANQSGWHEYACPGDGFAISLPNAPKKQSLQSENAYNLFRTEDASIDVQLSVSAAPLDCTARVRETRAMMNSGKLGFTETTFQGSPAFESIDRRTNGPRYVLYMLTQCRGDKSYRFHARWLSDHPKPEEVTRIFDSFRLLTKDNIQ